MHHKSQPTSTVLHSSSSCCCCLVMWHRPQLKALSVGSRQQQGEQHSHLSTTTCNMSNAAGARTAFQPQVLANQESGSKASHLDIYLERMGTSAQATRTVQQQQQQQQQQHQAGVLMSWGALASGGATVQTGQQPKVFVERGPAADLASGITAVKSSSAGRGHHHLHSKRVAGQPTTQQQKPLK